MENTTQNNNDGGLKSKVQNFGSFLSSMIMPNIAAFIAWGLMTALFIPAGWLPNEQLASMTDPMLTYLLPLLIAYQGGSKIHGQRGAVVGAITTFGVIVGSNIPMLIGAMILGPFGGWVIKKFDDAFQDKIKTGFEMLVNNFSAGIIGFLLAILAFYVVGPVVTGLNNLLAQGVAWVMSAGLLPLANIFIEPAKVLFLNNAINHGILTPLGLEQAAEAGQSTLFLLEANPGPGLGILIAFMVFGKGTSRSSATGASLIHFFGGIHEIYFPYILMKPTLFLAVIAGGISGTLTFTLLDAGLVAAASPGSIISVLALTARGSYIGVIAGVLIGAIVSFAVASVILKADKSEVTDEEFEASKEQTQEEKAASKGQTVESDSSAAPVTGTSEETETVAEEPETIDRDIDNIVFACDAGMGSSAMGASLMRKKVQEADLDIDVTNSSISNLEEKPNQLVITQKELTDRAKEVTPNADHVSVDNFLGSPKYDDIVKRIQGELESVDEVVVTDDESESEDTQEETKEESVDSVDAGNIDKVIFACDAGMGSSAMGASLLRKKAEESGVDIEVTNSSISNLEEQPNLLVITQKELTDRAKGVTPNADHISVDNFLSSPKYDDLIEKIKKQKT